jgi:asparagine synthase (glutamine-hydrolysing)
LCGIAGFTHRGWAPEPGRIQQAVQSIRHRGPDQQGVFESSTVSVGAARLKILDLSAGNQPIISEAGDAVIVFNGEIYNHLELRAELETLGHRFHSNSDTETVLAAFLEWDTDCFARLRGMFGVALWTESQRRLVIARDRMGIKPLYYSFAGEDIFFGSELKTLFVHPQIERRLSPEGLDCYLALNFVPCPYTLVDGIRKLEPGSWLEWRDGRIRNGVYWTLPAAAPRNIGLEEAKEELDVLLRRSVREHLLSDVPLGLWLSGGIDSSALLHYASSEVSGSLKTFSISFAGRSFDESRYIHEVTSHYGAAHEVMDLSPEEDLASTIEKFASYSDEPSADAGALPVWYLSQLTKRSVTVALSGEGADELFAGYLTYRANELARRARWAPAWARRAALSVFSWWPVSDDKISFEYKLKRFLEGSLLRPERAHVYWNGTFGDAEKQALVKQRLPPALGSILAPLGKAGDHLSSYLEFDQRYYLADDILVKSDRMSMAHAVEVRPAYLDHRIVEFAAGLPDELKMRGSYQKVVLKELMRGKLPRSILTRKKTGFDIPAHDWLRGPLRPLLTDTISSAMREHAGWFDGAAVNEVLRRHLERKANLGYHLWGLLILFLWMSKWRIQAAAQMTLAAPVSSSI